ncbi:MAG: ATP-dependent DNA helicase [Candidatus Melainabacteria bacterium]
MTDILDTYHQILQQLPDYEARPAQETMVRLLAEALENGRTQIIEAGTGSGKSFGYLIPILNQLSDHRPVVITTATITLQEQLMQEDLPFLLNAAGLEDKVRIKLVKGRGNYLCMQKMLETERDLPKHSPDRLQLNVLKGELGDGWDGDMATLDWSVGSGLWREIRSDSEDCLGPKCQFFVENPYRLAREDLDKADIIVANHALYLQDLVSGQSLLPAHSVVVVDEAHQFRHYAANAFTIRIGKYATTKLIQKIHRRLMPVPERLFHTISDTEAAILAWLFQTRQETMRIYPDALWLSMIERQIAALEELETWLGGMDVQQIPLFNDAVMKDSEFEKALIQKGKLVTQLQTLISKWRFFLYEDPLSQMRVNWAELNRHKMHYELKSTPLNVADLLHETCWQHKQGMLTSATLAVGGRLEYLQNDLGIPVAGSAVLESPFHFAGQCVLYLPTDMPDPNDRAFVMRLAEEAEKLVLATRGRAFVLFTSYQNMLQVSDALIPRLPFACKVQGDLPRHRLIEWFKETPESVIFATATFWEGVDIPGDSLTCVMMDKIPFNAPNDPVHQATVDVMKARGQDWFSEYALPQAIIRLKQGFGRLIRSKSDRGVVAIFDPRMLSKGYGKTILRSLPRVPVVHRVEDIPEACLNLDEVGV